MRHGTVFLTSPVTLNWILHIFMHVVGANNSSLELTKNALEYFSKHKRWWTDELYCGRSAPLVDGYYPVCDPFNPKTPCCSYYGRCGSTAEHCNCEGCVNYTKNPDLLLEEPVRPTRGIRTWHLVSEETEYPTCGPLAPPVDGYEATCNPDDVNKHCCSAYGFCGRGSNYCECKGCKNFREIPLAEALIPVQGKSEIRSIILAHFRKEKQEKRWWAWNDVIDKRGMCGKIAPLYDGYYPICNPFSPETQCCNEFGYCQKHCNCTKCTNYEEYPEKILEEPIRPTQLVTWHIISDKINWDSPICGPKAPKVGDHEATCNPDHEFLHCCSSNGFCGSGPAYCDCTGCVDYRKNRNDSSIKKPSILNNLILGYLSTRQRWWTVEDDPSKVGLCGKRAPILNGRYPVCDPFNNKTRCCSYEGQCGSSEDHCRCPGCVNYYQNPVLLVTESSRPTRDVLWHTNDHKLTPSHPKCGSRAPKIKDQEAICNPDDDFRHCCSKHGFCGSGTEYCDCAECINFRNVIISSHSGSTSYSQTTLQSDANPVSEEKGFSNEHEAPTVDHN